MIEKLLKQNKEISSYKIVKTSTISKEAYFVKGTLETIRETSNEEETVTIYVKHDEFLGDSSFIIRKKDDEQIILDKIANAINTAKTINDPPYELPDKDELRAVIPSNLEGKEFKEILKEIVDTLNEAIEETNAKVNAFEVFVRKFDKTILNSKGLKMEESYYKVFLEAIPTYDGEDDSVELYEDVNFSSFDKASLKEEFKYYLKAVEERFLSKAPEEDLTDYPVEFNLGEVSEIFDTIVGEVNYSTIYQQANLFHLGDKLQEEKPCLNIRLKGVIEGCSASSYFDSDGVRLFDKEIMSASCYIAEYGSNRFAQYLEKEVTGNLELIEVEPGEKDPEGDRLEIISMSGIQIDLFNDYIGGEVRLAYLHKGDKLIPLTQFSISASFKEAIATAKLSKSVGKNHYYFGPKKMLMKGFKKY